MKKCLVFWVLFNGLTAGAYADAPLNYWQDFSTAKTYIEQNKFNEAKLILEKLEQTKHNYNVEIPLGDTYVALGDFVRALSTYAAAYNNGISDNNLVISRVALFKMARVQLLMKHYQDAIDTYQKILVTKLSDLDKTVANSGLKMARTLQMDAALQEARDFIDKNNGKRAYEVVKPYLKKDPTFDVAIIAAQSFAIIDEPQQSFNYFKTGLAMSENTQQKVVALSGMIKMQLALDNIMLAQQYLLMLNKLPLSPKEKNELIKKKQDIANTIKTLKMDLLINRAHQYLSHNEGAAAYALVQGHLATEKNAVFYGVAAESMTMMDSPQKALYFYTQALAVSNKTADKIRAQFGIAKMNFWLANYVAAEKAFRQLLQYPLSSQQHELALAGLVKSLAYYDRPRLAYKQIPPKMPIKTKEMVVAASQAALWADWGDISRNILRNHPSLEKDINLNSGLGKDFQDLVWQTDLATWPNVLTPTAFASIDSETFHKKRALLDYKHYWRQEAQTVMGPDYIQYSQYKYYKLDAKGFYFGQILRPTRDLIVQGQVEPISYKNLTPYEQNNWQLLLWNAQGLYRPNDIVSINVLTQKEVIETFPAFNNKITDNQYASTLILNPLPYVRLNGALSRLDMSDTNSRNGYFLSGDVLAMPDWGVTVTGILREFSNKFNSRRYFSPHNYREQKILLQLGSKLGATWHYYANGGLGRQYITATPLSETASSPTYQWGLGINGPITSNVFMTIYYANTHQASAFINASDYSYQYGGISINILP